jgi:hypothetical protein
MSYRTVDYYDRQLRLFPDVLHYGKRIARVVQVMQDHACSCFAGN